MFFKHKAAFLSRWVESPLGRTEIREAFLVSAGKRGCTPWWHASWRAGEGGRSWVHKNKSDPELGM